MNEYEHEILSRLLVDLFLQSPRTRNEIQQFVSKDVTESIREDEDQKGNKNHGRKSKEA